MADLPVPVSDDLFKFLQYGVSGLSCICMLFGFWLFSLLLKIQENDKRFKLKLTAVIIYVATSLIFFFGGIFGQKIIGNQENAINVIVLPDSMPEGVNLPSLRNGKDKLIFINNAVTIKVKPDATLTLGLEELTTKIRELNKTIPHVAAINATLRTE